MADLEASIWQARSEESCGGRPERVRIEKLKHRAQQLHCGQMVPLNQTIVPRNRRGILETHGGFRRGRLGPPSLLVKAVCHWPPPEMSGRLTTYREVWKSPGARPAGSVSGITRIISAIRELYEYLWTDALREPAVLQPTDPIFAYHFYLLSEQEDNRLYLNLLCR